MYKTSLTLLTKDIKWDFLKFNSISFGFGAEVALAGFIGVALGGFLSTKLRNRYDRSDPVIAGTGLILSAPVLLTALLLARQTTIVSMVLVFFAMLGINLNWSIVADITLVSLTRVLKDRVLMCMSVLMFCPFLSLLFLSGTASHLFSER